MVLTRSSGKKRNDCVYKFKKPFVYGFILYRKSPDPCSPLVPPLRVYLLLQLLLLVLVQRQLRATQ